MKFVIQRVLEGKVKVNGEAVGKINKGLVVLIGFTHTDKSSDIKFAANKLLNMRLWDDDNGTRWKECVKSKNYEILLVSQFTLYSILKGNKPDFHKALDPGQAIKLYNTFVETLRSNYFPEKIQTGLFGEMMEVSLINDGPVTINWDYPEIEEKKDIIKVVSENGKNEVKDLKVNRKKNEAKQSDKLEKINLTKVTDDFPKLQENLNEEAKKIEIDINSKNVECDNENINIKMEQITINIDKKV